MLSQVAGAISIGPYDFNGFDTVVLIVLVISALYAFARGFLREIISIGALLVAIVVTLFVYGQFRFAMRDVVNPSWLADAALIFGAGALSYFIAAMLFARIAQTIGGEKPGLIDRILGAGFGVLRGLIVAALFVMVTTADYRASLEAAELRDYIQNNPGSLSPEVIARMPQSMRDQMAADPKDLPAMYRNSTFYPVLERIGDVIRSLPFADWRSYADRIKDGDFSGLAEEVGS